MAAAFGLKFRRLNGTTWPFFSKIDGPSLVGSQSDKATVFIHPPSSDFVGRANTRRSRARVMLTYKSRLCSSTALSRSVLVSCPVAMASPMATFDCAP
jgi:hypothetical protein